jgi:uncharacterized protein (TIGR02453 family)
VLIEKERTLRRMATVATGAERFSGFSDEAMQFFLELQAEQSRTWFKAHQDDFSRLWRRPLELFVAELCERLVDVYPGILDAEPHFFRIQRDTRFAKDKTPYKTFVAANVGIRASNGEEDHSQPGLYVSFGLEGEYVAIGAWHMTQAILARYRAMLDDPREGARVQRLVDELVAAGFQIEAMEKLKRVPPGFAQDHPRAELLKHKGLAVVTHPTDESIVGSRLLLDWATAQLRAAAPLMHLLDKALAAG